MGKSNLFSIPGRTFIACLAILGCQNERKIDWDVRARMFGAPLGALGNSKPLLHPRFNIFSSWIPGGSRFLIIDEMGKDIQTYHLAKNILSVWLDPNHQLIDRALGDERGSWICLEPSREAPYFCKELALSPKVNTGEISPSPAFKLEVRLSVTKIEFVEVGPGGTKANSKVLSQGYLERIELLEGPRTTHLRYAVRLLPKDANSPYVTVSVHNLERENNQAFMETGIEIPLPATSPYQVSQALPKTLLDGRSIFENLTQRGRYPLSLYLLDLKTRTSTNIFGELRVAR